jgi:hypothetical protein
VSFAGPPFMSAAARSALRASDGTGCPTVGAVLSVRSTLAELVSSITCRAYRWVEEPAALVEGDDEHCVIGIVATPAMLRSEENSLIVSRAGSTNWTPNSLAVVPHNWAIPAARERILDNLGAMFKPNPRPPMPLIVGTLYSSTRKGCAAIAAAK